MVGHGGCFLEQPEVAGVGRNGRKEVKEAVQAAARIYREHGSLIRAAIRFQAGTHFDPQVTETFLKMFKT